MYVLSMVHRTIHDIGKYNHNKCFALSLGNISIYMIQSLRSTYLFLHYQPLHNQGNVGSGAPEHRELPHFDSLVTCFAAFT